MYLTLAQSRQIRNCTQVCTETRFDIACGGSTNTGAPHVGWEHRRQGIGGNSCGRVGFIHIGLSPLVRRASRAHESWWTVRHLASMRDNYGF